MTPTYPDMDIKQTHGYTLTDHEGNVTEHNDRTVFRARTLIDGREAHAIVAISDKLMDDLGDAKAKAYAKKSLTEVLATA